MWTLLTNCLLLIQKLKSRRYIKSGTNKVAFLMQLHITYLKHMTLIGKHKRKWYQEYFKYILKKIIQYTKAFFYTHFVLYLLLQDPLPIYSTFYFNPLTLGLMLSGWFISNYYLFSYVVVAALTVVAAAVVVVAAAAVVVVVVVVTMVVVVVVGERGIVKTTPFCSHNLKCTDIIHVQKLQISYYFIW